MDVITADNIIKRYTAKEEAGQYDRLEIATSIINDIKDEDEDFVNTDLQLYALAHYIHEICIKHVNRHSM